MKVITDSGPPTRYGIGLSAVTERGHTPRDR